jgi:hypothetical protein
MPKIEGEAVQSGPLEVYIEHESERPGWVRLTTVVRRKHEKQYISLVRLRDLKRIVATL